VRLFYEAHAECVSGRVCAQCQIAKHSRAVDAAAYHQNVERRLSETFYLLVSRDRHSLHSLDQEHATKTLSRMNPAERRTHARR